MLATSVGKLSKLRILDWERQVCVCVVCAAGGYPGNYETGKEISGLDDAGKMKDVVVFHAGTKKSGDKILTSGGRVLGVTGLGATVNEAINKTYAAVSKINFEGMHYRKDIGAKALKF
jgi:phosphoribosylamine--glycine ligase